MNELDFVLLFIILLGVVVGWRRCLIRQLISVAGMYPTLLIAGYLYDIMGWTIADAFGIGLTSMHNFSFVLVVAIMTFIWELLSYKFFEGTRLPALHKLDNLLGGMVGIFYGALWAATMLILIQYSITRTGGSLETFVQESTLTPDLNSMLDQAVLKVLNPLFTGDLPKMYQAIYSFM
jgi:uncharacterized membrane protein required for colicin V production